ncbi:MAG: Tetratricopeptide repeat protein [Elusimicrobia bacterium ADurb.Bin231]|nr:MAG: Tetratricopeptide repeat protein [Elusimicrobia bacterium ADurb.Bin231]
MDYLEEIKKKYPDIVAFKEDDDNWENLGFSAMKNENYNEAQEFFEKLCLSQPKHHAGYEGLAYVHYKKHNQVKALWFMDKAISLVKEFLKDNSIDIEVVEEMKNNMVNIQNKDNLLEWWK